MSVFARTFALVAVFAATAFAPVARAEVKIGYFDVKRMLTELDEAKEARKRLQGDFDKKQKDLDAKKGELEKLQKEFQQKAAVLSQDAKDKMQMDFAAKLQGVQQQYMEFQQELGQKEQEALANLLTKLEPVVREIADAEGYTYVFEKSEGGLFYAPSQHDLTSQLIRKYNQRFPPGSAKPAPAAPAAPAKPAKK